MNESNEGWPEFKDIIGQLNKDDIKVADKEANGLLRGLGKLFKFEVLNEDFKGVGGVIIVCVLFTE